MKNVLTRLAVHVLVYFGFLWNCTPDWLWECSSIWVSMDGLYSPDWLCVCSSILGFCGWTVLARLAVRVHLIRVSVAKPSLTRLAVRVFVQYRFLWTDCTHQTGCAACSSNMGFCGWTVLTRLAVRVYRLIWVSVDGLYSPDWLCTCSSNMGFCGRTILTRLAVHVFV